MNHTGQASVAINVTLLEKINFACHQSAFAVLRKLVVCNADEERGLENLELRMESSPAFVAAKTWKIDRLVAGAELMIRDRDIQLDGGFLLGLTEAMKGSMRFTLMQNDEVFCERTLPVELLAHNEWGGNHYMPELLAAFCTPNDPAVDRILGKASQVLRKAGKPDGIDGYREGNRQRVWEQASAVYSAIVQQQIGYALPPSSFERNGQKIRSPGAIADSKVATCLDTTLLFAAVFEQASLNPVVVLTEGHALVGVWLEPEDFSSVMITDAELLRQRLALKELVLIETTLVTQHPSVPFSQAVQAGGKAVALDKDNQFVAAVDIRRARDHRINPLGLVVQRRNDVTGELEESLEPAFEDAPVLPSFSVTVGEDAMPDSASGRLERWQRKLLDLSARNPLLNHRPGKSSLSFVNANPAELEDLLAAGARITVTPFPKLNGADQDNEIFSQRSGDDLKESYAREALQKKQLLVDKSQEELDKSSVEIYRKAQTSLKEGGSNTLFLAIGFLLWKASEKDTQRHRAPLILLPVALERKSVRSGIKIAASDDEPRFNTTLLEMLKKDFGIELRGLHGALPEDASGVDVEGIWHQVRLAIKDVPGFEVIEEVVLGHFSFAKYLMWKDLVDRANALRENSVVRHLLDSPRDPYESDIRFVDPDHIDRDFTPADLLTPLPADSSQMAAVATADLGKDFVIIGPPGTGKSQTISNLIAHMLGKGKKVLFVSEKTAALEVVHRRLKDIGLGNFCLELHSNKARKADVLDQLRSSWTRASQSSVSEWQEEALRLKSLRDRLNTLVNSLHQRYANGLTPHYAMGVTIRDQDLATKADFNWASASAHSQEDLSRLREVADTLQVQALAIGDVSQHELASIDYSDWTPQWQEKLVVQAQQLDRSARVLDQRVKELIAALGIDIQVQAFDRLRALRELGQMLLDSYRQSSSFALEPDGVDRLEAMETVIRLLKDYVKAQAGLSCQYSSRAWQNLDPVQLEQQWNDANALWWPKSWFAKRMLVNQIKQAGARGVPDLSVDIGLLKQMKESAGQIDQLENLLSGLKGWQSYETDPEVLNQLQLLGARARTAVGKLADNTDSLIAIRSRIRTLLYDGNDLLAADAPVGRSVLGLIEELTRFDELKVQIEQLAGSEVWSVLDQSDSVLPAVSAWCQRICAQQQLLRDWCAWVRRRNEAIDLQLGTLVSAIEQGAVAAEDIRDTFEAAYCRWWSKAVIGENRLLSLFSSAEHEAAIQSFREMDSRFCQLTADYIAATLSGHIPDQDDVRKSSSWGILRHELQKKSRHKPVREMLEQMPDVVTTLAPCLMMSPLSIAQFLSADQSLFDVVIFDEASQITVWDAIGALARGKQVIVAGDPKQMPPTNFFARAENDPDGDLDGEGDLESILDELIGASIPSRVLNLHYRSRRESLIAFSNSRYYDNSLVTFPAPVHPDKGVRLVKPQGFYARGKARNNQGEARAIVEDILRRLNSSDEKIRKQSIGVVTFNTEQQSLIEDLLDKARAADPSIEWAFSEEQSLEPVFVKNLESVQGDERDVILFSITYGPDEAGHATMNFGPLNRTGGERRLNVAMTRARSEMVVFSTLSPEQIDLGRTKATAVADLKHFLEYAERGASALGTAVHGSLGDFESPFEVAVARALQNKGWKVHPQVGVSAYRIDLGVVHPDLPGIYLAGVECDGAMYHSSAYAKERDKIRQQVLEGLGWHMLRVWSTNWWVNQQYEIELLDTRLSERLAEDRQRRQDQGGTSDHPEDGKPDSVNHDSEMASDRNHPPIASQVRSSDNIVAQNGDSESGVVETYSTMDFSAYSLEPTQLYEESYRESLQEMIRVLVNTEGPIHELLLLQRIARVHSFKRAGTKMLERVNELASVSCDCSEESTGKFWWPEGTDESDKERYARTGNRSEETSKVDWICDTELKNIIKAKGVGNDLNGLCRVLGIHRLTAKVKERLDGLLQTENMV
jgi:very-short-patch-repair endonuclease